MKQPVPRSRVDKNTEHPILRSILIWLAIIPCAILNGGVREYLFRPLLGERLALVASGVVLAGIIILLATLFIPRLGRAGSPLPVWRIGLLWVLLTVTFETLLVLSQGAGIDGVLRNYDPRNGNLWIFVVAVTLLAPRLALWIRR